MLSSSNGPLQPENAFPTQPGGKAEKDQHAQQNE